MASKYKCYGVKTGRNPGVYDNWSDCQKQVIKFPGSLFKGFQTTEEAQEFVNGKGTQAPAANDAKPQEASVNIFVDGSYHNGRYSWAFAVYENGGLVATDNGVGEDLEAANLRNVAGEMAGAVKAIEWAETKDKKPITIHHDYTGLAHWADGSWQAKNKFTQEYAQFTSEKLSWVTFNKVAGHSGVEGNELVDKLAKKALGIK